MLLLAVVKNGGITAFSVREGEYAIGLNEALLHTPNLLILAIFLAAEGLKKESALFYRSAINLFESNDQIDFAGSLDDIKGIAPDELCVQGAAAHSILLRFFTLHEFAHIELGHVDLFQMDLNSTEGEASYTINSSNVNQIYECEQLADIFAIDQLLKNTQSSEVMWNNALFICGFFYFLEHIEEKRERNISLYHPPPGVRAREIEKYLLSRIGPQTNEAFHWLNWVLQTWKGNFVEKINLSIYSQDPSSIIKLFEEESTLMCDGINVELLGSNQLLGMSVTEVVINVAISFVAGIPASVVANYIYDEFIKNGKDVLRIEDCILSSREELEEFLKKTKDEGQNE